MSDDIREHSKSPALSWSKRPLARTKPVDSFSELCQQLTNVVAQQTALSDKLIEAFREAKDHTVPALSTSRLSAPNLEALRYTPSPDDMEEPKGVHFNHPIGDEDNFREVKKRKFNSESFNLVATNLETIRSCMTTVINEMRMVITGQIPLENQQNILTNIFALLNVINNNCNNCRSGLNGVERIIRSHDVPIRGSYSNPANMSEKGTQTKDLVDSSESDPDDKDSGLESNPSRQSESGNGTEDFRFYTEYDQLMESSIPQAITEEKPRHFFKSKMVSLPDTLFEAKISPKPRSKSGIIDESDTLKISSTGSEEANRPSVESLDNDVIITVSTDSLDVFDSTRSIPLISVGSLEADEDLKEKNPFQSLSAKIPKKRPFQRSKTIDTTRVVFDDEEVGTSFTSSTSSPKVEKESDFDLLEKEVNQIRFQCSTSSYSSQSRKDSLKSLVFGTRKRISSELKVLVQKLTQHRRRSKGAMEEITAEEMIQAIGERIDQLMQTSQYFGAILHETQHSSEKENLINYIDMIKTFHRPTSIPSNGTFNPLQRTDSDPSSDNNDRSRCVSPTTTGFSSYKTIEASYQRGFNEGVNYMRDEFEEELKKSKNYVRRFDTVSDRISSVVSFEVNSKYSFLYGSGAYFALIAAISFLFILIL